MAKSVDVNASRFRAFMYEQQIPYLPGHFSSSDKIAAYLDSVLPVGTEYAFIYHDRDTYTDDDVEKSRRLARSIYRDGVVGFTGSEDDYVAQHSVVSGSLKPCHIHLALYFPNAKSISSVASLLGDSLNSITKFVSSRGTRQAKQNLFSYLIHATSSSSADGKYRYSFSDVFSNFDYGAYVTGVSLAISAGGLDPDVIASRIFSNDLRMIDFLTDPVLSLFYVSNKSFVDNCISVYYQKQLNDYNRDPVTVIYIQGDSGSGKSVYAERYALKHYRDYCVSSSRNDAVQDYKGQDVMIFDDVRPDDFDASDWLKLLDPYHHGSSVRSRYYNKTLCVKCIILTCTTPFEDFFVFARRRGFSASEPVSQFMRRFSYVIKLTACPCMDGVLRAQADIFNVVPCSTYTRQVADQFVDYSYRLPDSPLFSTLVDIAPFSSSSSSFDQSAFII